MTGIGLFIKGEKITQQNWYPLPTLDYIVLSDKKVIARKDDKTFECDEDMLSVIFDMLVEDVWDVYKED